MFESGRSGLTEQAALLEAWQIESGQRDVATQTPGPELAALLGRDHGTLEDLAPGDLLDLVAGCERLMSWASAVQSDALVGLSQRLPDVPTGNGHESSLVVVEDEVAAALHLSRVAAGNKIDLALDLARLPGTRTSLLTGAICVARARAVADAVTGLTDEDARKVEERVLARAPQQNAPQLRRSLARAVIAIDPAAAERKRRRARKERRVVLTPATDGMAWLSAYLPAAVAQGCLRQVTLAARLHDGGADRRSADNRRADALANLLLGPSLDTRGVAAGHETPACANVSVTVPASTVLGMTDTPGHLAGYGPIDPDLVRELAFHPQSTWTRVLTDPASGTVVDVGTTRYRPPRPLDRLVRMRDGTCRFPGCGHPATTCDLDHSTAFPEGATSADNLSALCRHHHRLKHEGGWTVSHDDGHRLTWRSPLGRIYATDPP